MAEQLANNATTTLANSVSSSATTFTVTASTSVGFPTSGTFAAIIENEIVTVTAVSGTDGKTWTVTRATEPCAGVTIAAAHAAGTQITSVLTVRSLQAFQAAGSVSSFNARTGVVLPQAGDYSASQVGAPSGSGNSTGINTGDQTITLTGDVTGSGQATFAATLSTTGVTPGTYGDTTHVGTFTVDAKGRITSAINVAIAGGSSSGTVTSITAGAGLTGGTITVSGTIALTIPVLVSSGGTGIVALTAHSVLLGEGSSPVGFATTGTAGALMIDQGAGLDPAFTAMNGDATITAAGLIAIGAGRVTNSKLANSSLTVTAGTGLSGGGTVSLGGSITLSVVIPVPVLAGGTGDTSLTAYALLCGGTTSTGAVQQVVGLGTAGQVLTSAGAGALPTWTSVGGTGTVTSISGSGGTTGLTLTGGPITTTGTLTLGGTLVVANGGTGRTTGTAYGVVCGGTTATGALQDVGALGTSGQVLTSNGAGALPSWQGSTGGPNVTGYLIGFKLIYSSASVLLVGNTVGTCGYCRDGADSTFLSISAQQSVTVTTNGAINGNDSFTGTGTVTQSISSAAVSGSGTAFLTNFGTRALTGTVTSAGSAVTGSGTSFLTQVAVGDLIGSATLGYQQITAISTDTSLTTLAALGAVAAAVNVIENPTIKVGALAGTQVTKITSNTSLTVSQAAASTQTAQAFTIGVVPATTSMPTSGNCFFYVWIASGGSGTGVFVSTQRTTPFGITGYATSKRRVGSVLIVSGSIGFFEQWGSGNDKWYQIETAPNTEGTTILTSGSATTWTGISASSCAPPTAQALAITLNANGLLGGSLYVRSRAIYSDMNIRNSRMKCNDASNGSLAWLQTACDMAQNLEYQVSSGSVVASIFVNGYMESL